MFKQIPAWALALAAAAFIALPAQAVEVRGVKFADTTTVAGQALQLNGAGVRVRIVIDVYAAGLYVAKRDASAQAVLSQPGAKSMQIVLLRDLTGEDFADAMIKGFRKNNPEAEIAKHEARLEDIRKTMIAFGLVKKGTAIQLNFVPGSGTRTLVNGVQKGADIAGDDFYAAVLKIWLGNKPVDDELKEGLLSAK
ncbi:MAG: chalcone isomerase family protein [Burkholderiales bacterium]|nr:chalcone isomerase family protein [Burkholderiales bacterium]MBH2017374.1 chalcone isomerase family protein [Burkholderiales bacterium]